MVDPIWNESAKLHEDYKKVMIGIYGPEHIDIEPISDKDGMQFLIAGLKNAALTQTPVEK